MIEPKQGTLEFLRSGDSIYQGEGMEVLGAAEWKSSSPSLAARSYRTTVPAPHRPPAPHTKSPGVIIIGIGSQTPGGMSDVRRDEDGRAVALCVPHAQTSTLRFVGTYGPTAAKSNRSTSCSQSVREGNNLRTFITE